MNAENPAPNMKNTDRPTRTSVSPGSTNSNAKAIAANTASVLNCRVRYAWAPSSTAWPISCIFWVPVGAASTSLRNIQPIASATKAISKTRRRA